MKITKRQLRQIIKEAIRGHVHGDPKKPRFLDRAMSAIERSDYRKAANSIMDSFMIDDVSLEDEEKLISALSSLPSGRRSPADIESVADAWFEQTFGRRR